MKLAIDIDGCLADFNSSYKTFLIELTGRDLFPKGYDPRRPPCWHYPPFFGYTKEEYDGSWKEIAKRDHFWYDLGTEPFAIETIGRLDKLSKEGHEVYFVTNRLGILCKRQTELWLASHGMTFPTVIVAADKSPILRSLKIDLFVDDRLETVNETARQIEEGELHQFGLYLVDRSYNQEGRRNDLVVVESVQEMLRSESLWW